MRETAQRSLVVELETLRLKMAVLEKQQRDSNKRWTIIVSMVLLCYYFKYRYRSRTPNLEIIKNKEPKNGSSKEMES